MGLFETGNDIVKMVQQLDNIELNKKVLQLQIEMMDILEELHNLKDENRILKEQVKTKELLKFEDNLYWLINTDNQKQGPYCSKCWDADKKLIHHENQKDSGLYVCPNCRMAVEYMKVSLISDRGSFYD